MEQIASILNHGFFRVRIKNGAARPRILLIYRNTSESMVRKLAEVVSVPVEGPLYRKRTNTPYWECRIQGYKACDLIDDVASQLPSDKQYECLTAVETYRSRTRHGKQKASCQKTSRRKTTLPTDFEKTYIYVIQDSARPEAIKIGQTKQLRRRLSHCQTYHPYRGFSYAFYMASDQAEKIETLVHETLAEHRLNGEWFQCSPETAQSAIEAAAEVLMAAF